MSEQMINIEFVQEIEKHPCLYNNRIKEYARKDLTEKAWCKVGEKFSITGSQAKEKWKNLRTVFARNLRPPADPSAKRRKPYYLSEAMNFAAPFIKSQYRPSVFQYENLSARTLSQSECMETTIDQDEDEEDVPDSIGEIKLERDVLCVTVSPSPTASTSPPPSPQMNLQSSPRSYTINSPSRLIPAKRNSNSHDMYERDEDYDRRRSKEARISNMDQTMDQESKMSKKRFLLSLLPDVYAMNVTQMRSFRIKLLNLIDEVLQTP